MPYINIEQRNAYQRNRLITRRNEAIAFLGGQCSNTACGCSDTRVLQIDHKRSNGASERKNLTRGAFYKRVKEHPKDYQLLCANCNWIKRIEQNEQGGRHLKATAHP